MSDPAIKLFGKTISLPEISVTSSISGSSSNGVFAECQDQDSAPMSGDDSGNVGDGGGGTGNQGRESEKDIQEEKVAGCGQEQGEDTMNSGPMEKPETAKLKDGKAEEETQQNETGASSSSSSSSPHNQETKLKKPDKILPCPRCNSMDTKFCYYNNYNVNQPRHFCKNCQRYWTAGGTMRNVPVGAGRRKNKNSAALYNRHVNISAAEAMQKPNGASLLTFGSDALLCESMASGLNLVDKAMMKTRNGFHETSAEGLKIQIPYENNVKIYPNTSSEEAGVQSLPCFAAWPYTWNGVPWTVLSVYPPPPSGFWNCPAVPPAYWMAQPNSPSGSGPNSPTLGKHSREENTAASGTACKETEPPANEKSNPERCLWVPKTLRIDDPEEAAKSSIWETLGIKNDEKVETFRAFRSNNKEKSGSAAEENAAAASPRQPLPALKANPAALSRSANFHESS